MPGRTSSKSNTPARPVNSAAWNRAAPGRTPVFWENYSGTHVRRLIRAAGAKLYDRKTPITAAEAMA